MFYFWRGATAALVPGFLCQSGRRRLENVFILSSLVWNHDGDDDGDGRGNVENTTGLDPVYTGLDKCFNGKIFSRASRLHGTVQIPLQIAALFALQKLM